MGSISSWRAKGVKLKKNCLNERQFCAVRDVITLRRGQEREIINSDFLECFTWSVWTDRVTLRAANVCNRGTRKFPRNCIAVFPEYGEGEPEIYRYTFLLNQPRGALCSWRGSTPEIIRLLLSRVLFHASFFPFSLSRSLSTPILPPSFRYQFPIYLFFTSGLPQHSILLPSRVRLPHDLGRGNEGNCRFHLALALELDGEMWGLTSWDDPCNDR